MNQDFTVTAEQLLQAYAHGIFPMAADRDGEALDWYDPPQRGIIPLDGIHLTRSLAKLLRRERFTVTVNRDFATVMQSCAIVGLGGSELREDTWISPRIVKLYCELHARGHAHSVEVWQNDVLVGGLYGVTLGGAFFGESMFSRMPDASKIALAHLLAHLVRNGYTLCDTQYLTPHLATFGGIEITRADYRQRLATAIAKTAKFYSASVSCGNGSSATSADAGGADTGAAEVAALLAGTAGSAG